MKPTTVRNLLVLCLVLDLVLLGAVLYDVFQNEAALVVLLLALLAVVVVATAVLFLLATRVPRTEREVVRVVEAEPTPTYEAPPQPTGNVLPPIPPAPLRTTPFVAPVPPAKPRALAKAEPEGPFVYKGYTLHSRSVKLANAGGTRTIFFFSKRKPRSGKPCPKPAGYHVGVNERTGLPFLKKGAGADGEDLTPEAADAGYRPQCSAVTADGAQCRNSARAGSKYCGSHVGYQPRTEKGLAKAIEGEAWSEEDSRTDKQTVREADTKARVKGAPDTKPSVRRLWFGRRRTSA